jgi:ferric-dicitrate binding protein FerR (iron transport regulator)
MPADYQHFTEEDFVDDPFFQQWVHRPDPASRRFWEGWLREHPHQREVVENARQLLLSIRFEERPLAEERIESLWEKISPHLEDQLPGPATEHRPALSHTLLPTLWRWAAVLVLVAGAGLLAYFFTGPGSRTKYVTDYGETRSFALPDGSSVTLNAHSTLRVAGDWRDQPLREVWLEGEAFFRVKKATGRQAGRSGAVPAKFIVHTKDLDVEVLGTQFNVSTRQEQTEVVLQSGQVQLSLNALDQQVLMQPGEGVTFAQGRKRWNKRLVNVPAHRAWLEKKWVLEDTPLRKVAAMIADTYGVTVRPADEGLMSRKITGIIPTDNLDTLLEALSLSLNVQITRQGNQVLIAQTKP